MRTIGMPAGMWALFAGSFQRKLTDVLGYDRKTAARVTRAARREYRKLIGGLPDFEKGDRFRMNIVSCAMLAAFVLNMPRRPRVDELTAFYTAAMMTEPMKWFCRRAGKRKFSPEDIKGMKETAAFRAADRNPYSWNMEFLPYPDGSGYEARFSKCGICTLMRQLGLGDLIPAMCRLDYTMSEAGGADIFVRQYTVTADIRKGAENMIKTTLKIEGMMCSMCEAHINDVIRKAVPGAKKVSSSHAKGEASFLSEEAVDEKLLKNAVAATGYTCLSVNSAPYEKKGWFGRK